jgi:DNA-directed RNA polymerase subunit N (RpoN/RPB10)
MKTDLFLTFKGLSKENKENVIMAKSGVYNIDNIPNFDRGIISESSDTLGHETCADISGVIENSDAYDTRVHEELFRGSVFSKKYKTYNAMTKEFFKLDKIMDDVGNGVFYYIGCRSMFQDFDEKEYERINNESIRQQEKKKGIV